MDKFLGVSIADRALGDADTLTVSGTENVVKQAQQAPRVSKAVSSVPQVAVNNPLKKQYLPGMYRCDKFMRIIKELSYTHTKDDTGKIRKTHGTWSKAKNMIIFQKGVETRLTEDDLRLPAVRSLIDRKVIYRMG